MNSQTRPRVLHIVGDSKFGGGSVIISRLAALAAADGCDTDVLTTDPLLQKVLKDQGIGVVALDVIWRDIRPMRDLSGLWRLYRFLRKNRYDLVHTHTSKAGFVGRVAARMAGVPAILHTVHGFPFHEFSPRRELLVYAFLEKWAARCCHRVISVSNFHRDWGLKLGIAGPAKMTAIPNGINEDRIQPAASRADFRASMGAGPDDLVLLSTARLAPLKGVDRLVEAARFLEQRLHRQFHVWIAGTGPQEQYVRDLVKRLALENRVRFLGFQKEIGTLLAASDIVVLPTLHEGLSIALLESMAAGKAVVTTTIGSNREVAREGEGALLVPPANLDALVDGICKVAANPALAARLGQTARRIYLESYTESRMLEAYAAEYRQRLGHGRIEAAKPPKQSLAKRLLDVAVSSVTLLALSPVMLLAAAAVRLTSSGPVLFRQQRLGAGGRLFTFYKFRTMHQDVPDWRNPDGSCVSLEKDPRLTRVGGFLRRTSLDELPQLFNVLKGDMSLVGPRPDQADQLRFYTDAEKQKLRVRPGLTGLAQLNGRNSIPWSRRKELDLEYVNRQSFWLDLAILFKTIPYVLRRRDVFTQPATDASATTNSAHS